MRVGMRLSHRSCRALVLSGREVVGRAQHLDAPTLADAIDTVFGRLAARFGRDIVDVTVDVADALQDIGLGEVTVIRIAPRPPIDQIHEMRLPPPVAGFAVRIVHVRGGHDVRSRELAPLALDEFVRDLPTIFTGQVRAAAITAIGATASPAHESAIADAIFSHDNEVKISVSSDFYSNVYRDRDLTTVMNSGYTDAGEQVTALLQQARDRRLPAATLSYMKNDGGRAPIAQLGETPIHALFARWPARLQGAATLAAADGEILVAGAFGSRVGHSRESVLMTADVIRRGVGASIASNVVVSEEYSARLHRSHDFAAVVAETAASASAVLPDGITATVTTDDDLGLLGCASAPLTSWVDRLVTVASEDELRAMRHLVEEDAYTAIALAGADPARLRLAESNVFAMPYGHPGIVRVRVQAVGETARAASGSREFGPAALGVTGVGLGR